MPDAASRAIVSEQARCEACGKQAPFGREPCRRVHIDCESTGLSTLLHYKVTLIGRNHDGDLTSNSPEVSVQALTSAQLAEVSRGQLFGPCPHCGAYCPARIVPWQDPRPAHSSHTLNVELSNALHEAQRDAWEPEHKTDSKHWRADAKDRDLPACPKCRAMRGSPCLNKRRRVQKPHGAREWLFIDQFMGPAKPILGAAAR